MFRQAVALGRDLLWWHTWGERFAPAGQLSLPDGQAVEVRPVEGLPNDYGYDAESQNLTIGSGAFGPVSKEAWDFEVSGLRVIQTWLAYRKRVRKAKKSKRPSALDRLRPPRWDHAEELLLLLAVIEHTIEVTPAAAALLDRIVAGTLVAAADLPIPASIERKPPRNKGPLLQR